MEKELMELLANEGKKINEERANVSFNQNSIDIEEIDEEGYNLYGEKYYSTYDAFDRLKQIGALEKMSMKEIYEAAVDTVNYDGTSEEDIRYYDSMKDFRNDTQFDTDEDFKEFIESKYNVSPEDVEGSFIALDSIGSVEGYIFTNEDDYILEEIQDYFNRK